MEGIIIFVVIVTIMNLLDKKKPTAKRMPPADGKPNKDVLGDFRKKVNQRRSQNQAKNIPNDDAVVVADTGKAEHPYENGADDEYNKYQEYLAAHEKQNSEAYDPECEVPYDLSHKDHPHYDRGNGLPAGDKVTLAQAIVFGEILGKPRARQKRIVYGMRRR